MCDRHPPFDITRDRMLGDLSKAMDRARARAVVSNERQRIMLHRGPFVRNGFVVQDAARYNAWAAEQESTA